MQGNTLYSLPAALMLIVRAITTGKSKNESRPKKSCAHQNLSPIHSLFRKPLQRNSNAVVQPPPSRARRRRQ